MKTNEQYLDELRSINKNMDEYPNSNLDIANKNKCINGYNGFAQYIGDKLLRSQDNGVLSPLSLYYALICMFEGTGSQSASNYETLFKMDSSSFIEFYKYMLTTTDFSLDDEHYCASLNLLLSNKSNEIKFKEAYIEKLKKFYKGYIGSLNLEKEDTQNFLSEFVYENTSKKFKPSFSDLNEEINAILINTIDFKDSWINKELKVSRELFYNLNQKPTFQEFVHGTGKHTYIKDDEQIGLSIELENGFKFNIVMPNNKSNEIDLGLLSKFDNDANIKQGNVEFKIPKFHVKNIYENLVNLLIEAGLTGILRPKDGFSGMLEGKNSKSAISEISHGADFDLNENGISASAYTVIKMTRCCLRRPEKVEEKLTFNSSFVYSLTNKDGAIIFIGKVQNLD